MKSHFVRSLMGLAVACCLLGFSVKSFGQTATILVNGYPIASGDTLAICSSATQAFDVSTTGIGSTQTYAWTFQNGTPTTSFLKNPYVAFGSIGYNSVQMFAYGTDTATAQIVIQILPQVTAGVLSGWQSICAGNLLYALNRTNATGGNGVFSYDWQYSIGSTNNWVNTGIDSLSFMPSFSLTVDTWFRVKVVTSCGTFYTSPLKVTVYLPVNPGIIQTTIPNFSVCPGGIATIFQTLNSGGGATTTKTWQQRALGTTTWLPAVGTVSGNQLFASNITQSTEYRLVVSSCNTVSVTNTLLITVVSPVVFNAIQASGATTICHNTPAPTLSVTYTGGGGNVYLEWYKRVGTGSWQLIGNGATISPAGPLWTTTQYRVRANYSSSTGSCGTVYSNSIVVSVLTPINGWATISPNQNVCSGSLPTVLTKSNAYGADGLFSYMWQESTNGVTNWINTGITTLTYQPGQIPATRYYRVRTISTTCVDTFYSNVTRVKVLTPLFAGSLQPDTSNFCIGASVTINLTGTAGADSVYNRVWQYKPAGAVTWANLSGVGNSASYTKNNLLQSFHYRVIVQNTCGNDTSNIAIVNVASAINAGQISSTSGFTKVCPGQPAPPLQLMGYAGGIGAHNFNWQKKVGNGAWNTVGFNQDSFIETIPMTQNTTYRVQVSDQGGCGTATSDTLRITISDLPGLNDSIIGPAEVCIGSNGNYFRIVPGFGDSVYWQFANGTIINNGLDRIFLDVGYFSPLKTDTLYATFIDSQIGCERTIKFPIKLNGNIAPMSGTIALKAGTNQMVYSDSLTGYKFFWGDIERGSGYEYIYPNSNAHRYTFSVLDTANYIYFVKVTNTVCDNTIFYNASAAPFSVLEEDALAKFTLYPNPNGGVVHLSGPLNEIVELQLFGVNGIRIPLHVNQIERGIVLPAKMPAGIYTLVITTSKGNQTITFTRINQ